MIFGTLESLQMPVYFDWKLRSRIPISSTLLLLKVKSWLTIKSLQFKSLKQWSVSPFYRSPGFATQPSSPLMSSLSETSLTQESIRSKTVVKIYIILKQEQMNIQRGRYYKLQLIELKLLLLLNAQNALLDLTSAFLQVTQGYLPCSVTPTTGVSWWRMWHIRTRDSMSARSPLTPQRSCTLGL